MAKASSTSTPAPHFLNTHEMSKLVVIVGITGNQGGSVANTFLTDKSWRIRAITRNPSSASAKEWASRGVEIVRADMDDVSSLTAAFIGAHAIFTMTDFWVPFTDPAVRAEAARRGVTNEEHCAGIETQRGKNLARAAADAEVLTTLHRYVFSSLPNHSKLSGGKYTEVCHFDSKASVEQYIRDDPELGPRSSFIHIGVYTDNWTRTTLEIQKDPATGGFWHVDIADCRRPVPFIWVQKDTGPLVKKLIEDVQPGSRLMGVSETMTYREFMATWARVTGKKLAGDEGIRQVSEQEYKDMVGGDDSHKAHIIQFFQMSRDLGYDGGDKDTVYPQDIGAGDLVSSFEEYVRQEDWSGIEEQKTFW